VRQQTILTFDGVSRPVREWERLTGVRRQTLTRRAAKGLPDELCLRRKSEFVAKDHPLWRTWRGMLERCQSPTHIAYRHYGGRGITVCRRWRDDFFSFVADMGAKPSAEYSLDRINNNGNYEPGNCRWATWKQQAANKRPRPSQRFEWEGEMLTRKELAEKLGLGSRQAASYRLGLTGPRRKTRRPYTCSRCGNQGHQARCCTSGSK
jgi:hypothetical protein